MYAIGTRYISFNSNYIFKKVIVGVDTELGKYIVRKDLGSDTYKKVRCDYEGVSIDKLEKCFVTCDDIENYILEKQENLKEYLNLFYTIAQHNYDPAFARKLRSVKECVEELKLLEKGYKESVNYSILYKQLKKGIRRAEKVLYRYFGTQTRFYVDSIFNGTFVEKYNSYMELQLVLKNKEEMLLYLE